MVVVHATRQCRLCRVQIYLTGDIARLICRRGVR